MGIAILAWGSLIWCPGDLAIASRWRPGPDLPVEFARKSNDDRVTLVLHGEHPSQTFWAESSEHSVDAACSNLWRREGKTKYGSIHFTTGDGLRTWKNGSTEDGSLDVSDIVTDWLDRTPNVDIAVWTGLPTKGFSQEDVTLASQVVEHLRNLDKSSMRRAKEYVQLAPTTVRTPVRAALEDPPLRWLPRDLPAVLFDPTPPG